MIREYHHWYSPSLEREMELLFYGHGGQNFLVFPTSMGRFYEFEDHGMINALSQYIEKGYVRVTTVDSIDKESWYGLGLDVNDAVENHIRYDGYIKKEVIPFIISKTQHSYISTVGCSFGGYHAINFAFRYPDIIKKVISLSGYFDVRHLFEGYFSDNLYYYCPIEYLPNMTEENSALYLRKLGRMQINLLTGTNDFCKWENQKLSEILSNISVPNNLDVWSGSDHNWYWWAKQIIKYV